MFAQMQKANIGGRALGFAQDGDPESSAVLVLIHAFPVGVGVFARQRGVFDGWRVIAPALPGFDGSDLCEPATVDAYAARVLAMLDELHVSRAVFGGVSLGGYVAFAVLRQAPDRVVGLMLADTRSGADTEEALAGRRRLLGIAESSGPSGIADEMIPRLLGRDTQERRADVVAEVRGMIARQTADGLAAAVRVLMSRPDSTPLLPAIAAPTLVIVGDQDTVTPPAEMERMAAAIDGAAFVRVAGAGHLANLESPDAFNYAARGLLARCEGTLRARQA